MLTRACTGSPPAPPPRSRSSQNFIGQLLPHIDTVKRQLPPARGTLDNNINRMVTFIRGMAQFDYRR
jgi:hypothetical protein